MMRAIGRTRAASAASPKDAAIPPASTQTNLSSAGTGAGWIASASPTSVGGWTMKAPYAAGAMRLDRPVHHLAGHLGRRHLDFGDLLAGLLVANRVHAPGGVQRQQPGLVDRDPGVGDALAVAAEVHQRLAEGGARQPALDGQLERHLGLADQPHAVVHATGTEPPLGDLEGTSLTEQDVLLRHPDVVEADLAVPDRPFTFHEFLIAQAVGDGQVLAEKGRPVLRLHLDSPADLDAVRQALR